MTPADAVDALILAAHHVGRGDGEISAVIEAREVVLALLDDRNDQREGARALCRAMAEWKRTEPACTAPPIMTCDDDDAVELAEEAVRQFHPERGRRGAADTPWHAWDLAAKLLAKGCRP